MFIALWKDRRNASFLQMIHRKSLSPVSPVPSLVLQLTGGAQLHLTDADLGADLIPCMPAQSRAEGGRQRAAAGPGQGFKASETLSPGLQKMTNHLGSVLLCAQRV